MAIVVVRFLSVVVVVAAAGVGAHDVTPVTRGKICSIRRPQLGSSDNGSAVVHDDDDPGNPRRRRRECYPCRIPSTVVGCLVENGLFLGEDGGATRHGGDQFPSFQDSSEKIYYKDNLAKIPDVNDTGREFYTYRWFLEIPSPIQEVDSARSPSQNERQRFERKDGNGPYHQVRDQFFLQFRGISYRSTIYYQFGDDVDADSDDDEGCINCVVIRETADGMWHRHTVDVTAYAYNNTLHKIFVLVEPPLHPGIASSHCPPPPKPKPPPTPKPLSPHTPSIDGYSNKDDDEPPPPPPCGQGGDHQLAQDAGAMQFAAGWDWSQGIPDRVTGIFDKVELLRVRGGGVRIQDSYLRTTSILCDAGMDDSDDDCIDRDTNQTGALVSVETTMSNHLDVPVSGTIWLEVVDRNRRGSGCSNLGAKACREHNDTVMISVNQSVTLAAMETRVHEWNNLTLKGVRLWWPHTMGEPYLYTGRVYFTLDTDPGDHSHDIIVTDQDGWKIGIRMVSTSICSRSGGRVFYINRRRVFLQGGNWIATDAMLQRGTRDRYFSEVALHQFAGLNLIRVWGGGLTERPEFYEACDELGILVLQEFWMSGDNNGRWAGSYDWPLDHDSYLEQAMDMVLMVRKHPSLLFWCAGNELWPLSKNPPPKIQVGLRKIISEMDKDRFLIMSSMDGGYQGGNMSEHVDTFALAVQDGPYDMLTPSTYFGERNPGMKNGTTAVTAFQPEVGSSGMPRYEALQRMGLADSETDFPNEALGYVPMLWTYHKYQSFVLRDVVNNNALSDGIAAYGEPRSLQDYVARAQLVCLQQYQSLFEGFTSKMFDRKEAGGKTAVIMWKTQSPWPALRGFLYDWWLGNTGSLDGVRAGTGGRHRSLKLQLNLATMRVEIVNRGRLPYSEPSHVTVSWYTLDGTNVLLQDGIFVEPVDGGSVGRSASPIQTPQTDGGDKVFFVQVMSPPPLDTSWYWMALNSTGTGFSYNYAELGAWRDDGPHPKVSGSVRNVTIDDTGVWWTATLTVRVDPVGSLAFAPSFSARDAGGELLLPLLADSPTVLIGGDTDIPLRVRLPPENGACVRKVSCDFWAGDRLDILVGEADCGVPDFLNRKEETG